MSIGFKTVTSELAAQAKYLEALNSQISDANVSNNFLLFTAPEHLKEIENEVRSIAKRSLVFANQFNKPIDTLREKCDSIKELLNTIYLKKIQIHAQQSERCNTHLNEQLDAIYTIYASQKSFSCIKASPDLNNKLERMGTFLALSSQSLTNRTSSSSSSSTDSSF